jgi:tRNA pseudouridine13 synthase
VPARYVTADLPGVGGRLKVRPEDFLVEEIPAYNPCGEGEHLYLMVQKTGLSTLQMVGVVARHFRVKPWVVGFSGLKDKHAITRQVVSVPLGRKAPEDFPSLQHPKVTILWAERHTNKLRRGHHLGNRFSIRVRDTSATAVLRAKRIIDRLAERGIPNRYAEQRFGHALNNHLIGRSMILGQWQGAADELLSPAGDTRPEHARAHELYKAGAFAEAMALMPGGAETEASVLAGLAKGLSPEAAFSRLGETERTFFLSSFQSAVFNALLDRRVVDGTWDRLLPGDLACKHENDAVFAVGNAPASDADLAARLAAKEISPTGPMWGPQMKRAGGEADALEVGALRAFGVSIEVLEAFSKRGVAGGLAGARRALRVAVGFPEVEGGADEFGHYIRCAFELPAGSFATVVMREVMKPEQAAG